MASSTNQTLNQTSSQPKSTWFYNFVKLIVLFLIRNIYGLRVTGTENVPREGGLLVVSNHITSLDPPVLGVGFPRVMSFMAKKELFESKWFGLFIRNLHAFPVDRSGNASGAVKESIRRLKAGAVTVIFIQGTRYAEQGQAFDGASFIAQRAKVPVLPAAIWREGRWFHVRYGEAFEADGSSREAMKALTATLMSKVDDLLPDEHKIAFRLAEEKGKAE